VGTQLPFDRLTLAADEWAGRNPEIQVVMQIGAKSTPPKHALYRVAYSEEEWEQLFVKSNLIVSHAGMGTIIRCLEFNKPLIIMPRQAALGEHRNDHQVATAKRFSKFSTISLANDSSELFFALEHPPERTLDDNPDMETNRKRLIQEIRAFLGLE
jgi:UDP-N-acetylglucosamine transferase subunit ALG13